MLMFRKFAGAALSGSILSATTLAMLTSVTVSRAETPAATGKAWVDPGAIERAKTQGASPDQQPAPQPPATAAPAAPAPATTAKEPVVKDKTDTAAEKEKLREIIQKSEKKDEKATAESVHAPEKKAIPVEARETATPSVPTAPAYAHKATRKAHRVVKRRTPIHYAHDLLPSRKDGPATDVATPVFDPFTGYAQPVRAAY
jgi:hypothetical protein